MYLPKLSEEQQSVVDHTKKGYNVIVDAVAGSGKTTTILHIAVANPGKKIILLTYNARLKDETRERVFLNSIENLEAHSYHAFCVKYYSRAAYTDVGIQRILDDGMRPLQDISFDILVIDEAQDMTPMLYNIANKIICDSVNYRLANEVPPDSSESSDSESYDFGDVYAELTPSLDDTIESICESERNGKYRICVFGDVMQNIYGFKYSDGRYLSMANEIFKYQGEWVRLPMSYSFRITSPMADFLNKIVLNAPRMRSTKPGAKVDYLICNPFSKSVFEYLSKLLITYQPSDVFIIAPSIKSSSKNNPISVLENHIVDAGYPCFAPIDEDIMLRPTDIAGKLVFTTIHQAKGLERKIVIMFGFDESYFKYFDRRGNQNVCPNGIYVGITRATERLCVIHSGVQNYLKFLNTAMLPDVCNVMMKTKFIPETQNSPPQRNFTVTELVKYLDANFTNTLVQDVTVIHEVKIRNREVKVNTPIGFVSRHEGEIVSDINGLCIPMIYEYQATKTTSIFKHVFESDDLEKIPKAHKAMVNRLKLKYDKGTELSLSEYMYISNVYVAMSEGYHFKISQIKNYNWLEVSQIRNAISILRKYIPAKRATFERNVSVKLGEVCVTGRIDIISIDPGTEIVWEIKCVDVLTDSHILQLICYAYMYEKLSTSEGKKTPRRYMLLSIKNDSMIEIVADILTLEIVIKKLIAEKTRNTKHISDQEFVAGHSK